VHAARTLTPLAHQQCCADLNAAGVLHGVTSGSLHGLCLQVQCMCWDSVCWGCSWGWLLSVARCGAVLQEFADLGTLNDRSQEGWIKGDLVRCWIPGSIKVAECMPACGQHIPKALLLCLGHSNMSQVDYLAPGRLGRSPVVCAAFLLGAGAEEILWLCMRQSGRGGASIKVAACWMTDCCSLPLRCCRPRSCCACWTWRPA
jgi:hypothetical protein